MFAMKFDLKGDKLTDKLQALDQYIRKSHQLIVDQKEAKIGQIVSIYGEKETKIILEKEKLLFRCQFL